MCRLILIRTALACLAACLFPLLLANAQNFPPAARIVLERSEAFVDEPVAFSSAGSSDPDGAPQPLSFEWDFADGSSSTAANPVHAFAALGHYRVSLTVSDGADSDVASASVFVLARPAPGKPAKSSPIAFSPDEAWLWMANPDSDTVTLFSLTGSNAVKAAEVPIGKHPRTVATSLDGALLFVSCQEANQLWIINTAAHTFNRRITVGHQPYGVAVAPGSGVVLVSNQGDNTLAIIDSALEVAKIVPVGRSPRAIAITSDGARAYVSHFITRGSQGQITEIDLGTRTVSRTISLDQNPGPDTPSSGAGIPNVLSALAVEPSGRQVWVGGLKSNSRRGLFLSGRALTPENTVRGFFGPMSIDSGLELSDRRIDSNNADSISAIAFSPSGRYAYVTHQGAEALSVYDLPAASLIQPGDGTPVPFDSRIDVGNAPQGILVSSNGQRAYVANFLSRDLMTLDLSNPASPAAIASTSSTAEPLPAAIAGGKRLFYRSRAPKHAKDNYIACVSCHADGGMDDGQSWDFTQRGEGLRNTIDLRGRAGMGHGPVHWSANFDEIQDFENDIVNEFGGTGLAQDGQPPNPPLGTPNAGRSQDLDDLAAYVASLGIPPRSPFRKPDGALPEDALRGKALFSSPSLQCAACHIPRRFTDSVITNSGSFILHDVGTMTSASGSRLGAPLTGFDTPTLIGLWDSAPFLHDGSATDLEAVLTIKNADDKHGVTSSLAPGQRADLIAYLLSLDGTFSDEPVDADEDGLSDAWEISYNLQPDNPADASADVDGDGMTNLEEFLSNTDPREFHSRLRVRPTPLPGSFAVAIPTSRQTAYSIQSSFSLTGSWTNQVNFNGDGALFLFAQPINSSMKFFRVVIPPR